VITVLKKMMRHALKWFLIERRRIVGVEWVAILLRVLGVLDSDPCPGTDCPDGSYSRISFVLPDNPMRVGLPESIPVSLLHSIQTGSGAYPSSYTVDTRDFFPRSKAARA
jgi:hypothetical protein